MPRSTPQQKKKSEEQWVEVASFGGATAEGDADLCAAMLQGHAIPVVRLPMNTMSALGGIGAPTTQPIRVLVPPDREADAKELLSDDAIEVTASEEE